MLGNHIVLIGAGSQVLYQISATSHLNGIAKSIITVGQRGNVGNDNLVLGISHVNDMQVISHEACRLEGTRRAGPVGQERRAGHLGCGMQLREHFQIDDIRRIGYSVNRIVRLNTDAPREEAIFGNIYGRTVTEIDREHVKAHAIEAGRNPCRRLVKIAELFRVEDKQHVIVKIDAVGYFAHFGVKDSKGLTIYILHWRVVIGNIITIRILDKHERQLLHSCTPLLPIFNRGIRRFWDCALGHRTQRESQSHQH